MGLSVTPGYVNSALILDGSIVDADIAAAAGIQLSKLATSTSAQLAAIINDETGTGNLVFNTSPSFTTDIRTPLVTTATAANLLLSTNTGTSSGTITINQGANANIALTPNGTGAVLIGDQSSAGIVTTGSLTSNLTLNTNNGVTTGSIVITAGTNGNISLTPNGTGKVVVPTLSATSVSATNYTYPTGEPIGYTYDLDNISAKFDNITTTFGLTYNNGTPISPNHPNKVEILIGGIQISPAKIIADYFNLPDIPVFSAGYTITQLAISSVAIADAVGTLTVSAGLYYIGQPITISGTFTAGSISTYTTGTTYYVGKINSTTSIQITNTYANATASSPVFALTTTTGTITPGATVTAGSAITFATAPRRGMSFYGKIRTNQDPAPTFNYTQVPFSALNIMLRS
jgi:hypothetical protein